MIAQALQQHRDALNPLCRRFKVRNLELFGSACRNDFSVETSDFDFLVEFEDMAPSEYADAYFNFMEALNDLYQRPVDLVVYSAIKNPYFKQHIDKSKVLIYAN